MLRVTDLEVSYGAIPAVRKVSLELNDGEVRVVLGANGAGKTTIIRTILGLQKAKAGSVEFGGQGILGLPAHRISGLGIKWVPEGRQLWGALTVLDNLRLGLFGESDSARSEARIEEMLRRFPVLKARQLQMAGSLSGGEQQMLALARALVSQPRLLMMDEPSLGLAPLVVRQVFELVKDISSSTAILMVEQNARQALGVANWAYLLEMGRIVTEGSATDLAANAKVQDVFLGGSASGEAG